MNNNGIVINIADNKLQASLSYTSEKRDISLTELIGVIKEEGVISGIKREVLNVVIESIKNGKGLNKIIIAEGAKPFQGEKPSIDYKFTISNKPTVDESGRTNYRELSNIVNVKADQLLAVKRKLKPPINGITVTGERTNFPPIQDIPLIAETNIIKDEQENSIFYRAATDGALSFKNNVLSVFPEYKIDDDVDFSVGNIHFKGDVKIGRDILPDFVVSCEGKLLVYGSAIACSISAQLDIDIRGGIVGKNKGEAKSEKNIFATFVENANLYAGEDIVVKNGIIGSEVLCNGYLKIESRKARIVGSSVRAGKGIITYNAGSRFDTSTKIITGIDGDKEKEYFQIKELFNKRIGEAKEIEKRYGRSTLENKNFSSSISPHVKKEIKKWDILRDQIKQIHILLNEKEALMYDYSAIIRVKENLYPRVFLKIGKFEITTSKEYYNVTVKYSEELDRLEII